MPERFLYYWSALLVFSIVSLTSVINQLPGNNVNNWNREEKWVVSVAIISLALSAIGGISHVIIRDRFVGSEVESLLVSIPSKGKRDLVGFPLEVS